VKLLLDTHLLLWAAGMPDKLPPLARVMIDEPGNQLTYSAASLWEISIRNSLGRPDFQVDPRVLRRALLDNDYLELPITGEHAAAVGGLPVLHADPFDRILVAQSMIEGLLLLTSDSIVAQYPGPIKKV
jgi:PIN domain nuclease of toxin-antitoxin system